MPQASDNTSPGRDEPGHPQPGRDERDALGRGGVFGLDIPLVRAIAASILLHALFMVGAHSLPSRDLSLGIEFRESRGVALMSRIGYAPPSDSSSQFTEVDLPPEPGDDTESENDIEPAEGSGGAPIEEEAPTDEEGAETDEEADPEADEGEDDAEEDAAEEDDESETETVPVIPPDERESNTGTATPTPRPTRPRTEPEEPVRERPDAGTGEGQGGDAEAEVDPADLPPRERYPEGTLNPVATDVGMWGPEGAASVALIRSDRVRNSPHREAVTTIFSGLGDYRDLAARTHIDPIEDVDVMLLASTNIYDASRTFVAALHHLDPGYLMSELSRGYPTGVNWEERSGRYYGTPGAAGTLPRRFVIPTEQLLIFSRPEYIDPLLADAPRPRGLEGALNPTDFPAPPPTLEEVLVELGLPDERPEQYDGSGICDDNSGPSRRRCLNRVTERRERSARAIAAYDEQRETLLPQAQARVQQATRAYANARGNGARNTPDGNVPVRADDSWIEGLMGMGDLAGTGSSGPAILWTFNGFTAFNLGGLRRNTVSPQQLVAALELGRNPELRARFIFPDQAAAEDFRNQWGEVVAHYTFPLTAAGLLRAFRNAEWEIDQNEAIATISVPAAAMSRLATAIRMLGG